MRLVCTCGGFTSCIIYTHLESDGRLVERSLVTRPRWGRETFLSSHTAKARQIEAKGESLCECSRESAHYQLATPRFYLTAVEGREFLE